MSDDYIEDKAEAIANEIREMLIEKIEAVLEHIYDKREVIK